MSLRVGVHFGPVVAGVIGKRKFAYDLWGDTVNLASRMESHGVPWRVQLTAVTWERVKHLYDADNRGLLEVKGKGSQRAFLLKRRSVALTTPG